MQARQLTPTSYYSDARALALYVVPAASSNSSPTDIILSSTQVSVNGGVNAVVGTLSTVDADVDDTHTYTLVAGTGDTDNASFNISSDQLRANNATTLGVGNYGVRIQTDDGVSTPYAEAFSVSVVESGGGSAFTSIYNFLEFSQ